MRRAMVTGSCGLVGSAVAETLLRNGWRVLGVDNDARMRYFGTTTSGVLQTLRGYMDYGHMSADVTDACKVDRAVQLARPELVVHCAAQPSHDWAARAPLEDFAVNAVGTLNVLEAARQHALSASVVHMSTNKVYGDLAGMPVSDTPTRFVGAEVDERWPVDRTMHSVFGASKLAADIMVQEYGLYFGMNTCCLRMGCITGANHQGAEQHGFLSYLFACAKQGLPYTVHGWEGKQVRDNVHAADVARMVLLYHERPRPAAVYNIGGGAANSCSVREALDAAEQRVGAMEVEYGPTPRKGDHRYYVTDYTQANRDYGWYPERSLESIYDELARD